MKTNIDGLVLIMISSGIAILIILIVMLYTLSPANCEACKNIATEIQQVRIELKQLKRQALSEEVRLSWMAGEMYSDPFKQAITSVCGQCHGGAE